MARRVVWCWLVLLGGACYLSVSVVDAQSTACRKTLTNPMGIGTPRQPIVVGTTAVDVAPQNTSRCTLLIFNSSENPMTCMDVTNDGTPTASTGIPVSAGNSLSLEFEGQGRWMCVRTGSADALAVVAEGLP